MTLTKIATGMLFRKSHQKFMIVFEYLLCSKNRSYSTRKSLDSLKPGQAQQMKL